MDVCGPGDLESASGSRERHGTASGPCGMNMEGHLPLVPPHIHPTRTTSHPVALTRSQGAPEIPRTPNIHGTKKQQLLGHMYMTKRNKTISL